MDASKPYSWGGWATAGELKQMVTLFSWHKQGVSELENLPFFTKPTILIPVPEIHIPPGWCILKFCTSNIKSAIYGSLSVHHPWNAKHPSTAPHGQIHTYLIAIASHIKSSNPISFWLHCQLITPSHQIINTPSHLPIQSLLHITFSSLLTHPNKLPKIEFKTRSSWPKFWYSFWIWFRLQLVIWLVILEWSIEKAIHVP